MNNEPQQTAPTNPWPAVMGATFATIPVTMDGLMTNQAYGNIMGGLGADPSSVTWVNTAIYTAEALGLPLAAWCAKNLGRKNTVMGALIVVIACYALCATAQSFAFLIAVRFLMGFCFGLILPLTMAIIKDAMPPEKVAVGMAIYGVGLGLGAGLGPINAGVILDGFFWPVDMWRHIFWFLMMIVVPGTLLTAKFVHDPPRPADAQRSPLDIVGVVLLLLGFASLQVYVAKGTQFDWNVTYWERTLLMLVPFGLIGLVIWCLKCTKTPVLDLSCMKERNLVVSCALIFLLLISQYGAILSIPQMLNKIFEYDAITSGKLSTWSVVPALIAMPIAGALSGKIGLKGVAMLGVIIQVFAYHGMWGFYFDTDFFTVWAWYWLFWIGVNFLQFCSMTLALSWVPQRLVNDASSIFNVIKFTGAGIGIGAASIIASLRSQFWTQRTGELLNPYRDEVSAVLRAGGDVTGSAASEPTAVLLAQQGNQVNMLTYIDTFFVFTLISASLMICIIAMKNLPTPEQKAELERKDAELVRKMQAREQQNAAATPALQD